MVLAYFMVCLPNSEFKNISTEENMKRVSDLKHIRLLMRLDTGNRAQQTINEAKEARIDAYALSMTHGEETDDKSVKDVFYTERLGFRPFFNFNYASSGPWRRKPSWRWLDGTATAQLTSATSASL